MAYQLGKNRPVVDERTLQLDKYLSPALPPPPASINWGSRVATWPMYYNDQYGDCTSAAAGHQVQAWTSNAGREMTPPPASVLAFYEHFVGDPPPPDAGCDILSVLKYWRTSGLDGHRIGAFAAVKLRDHTLAMQAISLFGGIYLGIALPDFAVQGDMLAVPWVVPPSGPVGEAEPNPDNGHCVVAVGYDAENLTVVTWGELKSMSWEFYDGYSDEVFALLSTDFIEASGQSPEGFDLSALQDDLAKI